MAILIIFAVGLGVWLFYDYSPSKEITASPTPVIVGGDKDEHGCIGSAGYSWCELKQKCLRIWEEPCENIVGGDKDAHGCIGSAGYSWCEAKQKCLRTWEEPCDACFLETCHGLDISCGPNPPGACTMMYAMGDKCLQYAKCGILNGQCQQIVNTQFTECKACVQACINSNANDSVKMFECESKCK